LRTHAESVTRSTFGIAVERSGEVRPAIRRTGGGT